MFSRSRTFKDILDAHRGIGPGFDVLRVLLAVTIFYCHAKWVSGHALIDHAVPLGTAVAQTPMPVNLEEAGWSGWKRPIQVSFVPAFFAVSGFLVTGSAIRTRVTSTFLAFRALRIFPALVTEVTLSAMLLGFFLTTFSPSEYFSNVAFFRYFGNIVGWVTYELPGVFVNNPVRGVVNANLWTLPAEFDCYLITAVLMASGIIYKRTTITIIFSIVTISFAILNIFGDFSVTRSTMAPVAVTYYFFMGVIFFHWREKIPFSWTLFGVSAAIGYVLQLGHHAVYIAPIFVTYCAIFFGMLKFPKNKMISSGDYSYGIYLYGFPITQAAVQVIPGLRGNGWATVGVAGLITIAFAVASWHWIEKPALALKRRLPTKFFPSSKPTLVTPKERAEAAS